MSQEGAWAFAKKTKLSRFRYGESYHLFQELPFTKWEASALRDIEMTMQLQGLCSIIAHGMKQRPTNLGETEQNLHRNMCPDGVINRVYSKGGFRRDERPPWVE